MLGFFHCMCQFNLVLTCCFLQITNVYVPFLFKYAVDHLNEHQTAADAMATGGQAATVITALLIGCKFSLLFVCVPNTLEGNHNN